MTNTNATARPICSLTFAPLEGWRRVKVTDRLIRNWIMPRRSKIYRTATSPNAKKIVLYRTISTPTNPHCCTRLFQHIKARRLVERFEWHYTPKHGSWLDMAESELAVLASQMSRLPHPDKQILIQQVAAWEADCNAHHTKADWQFTTDDARIKLKHLYRLFR